MAKQAIVLGLGQFGMSMTRALSHRGVEVLAVDADLRRVEAAAEFAARAVCFDATDEAALADTAPAKRDVSVCAIGDESRESSIIATALLRQFGAPFIVARATDALHERILLLVGAHEVVNPERSFGERLAARIALTGVIDEVPLGPDLVMTEVRAPAGVVGRTLVELALPARFGVNVVAIRRQAPGTESAVVLPRPDLPFQPGDVLVLVARPGKAVEFVERS